VNALGGGRLRAEDPIDPAVGLSGLPQVGERVESGQPLVSIHASGASDIEEAEQRFMQAVTLSEAPPARLRPAIHQRLTAS
jgi:thymidine phosphorylase